MSNVISFFQRLFNRSTDREAALGRFTERYRQFKDLLEANAQIARILALLDTVYHGNKQLETVQIRHEIRRGIAAARIMSDSLNALSGNRYTSLNDSLDHIAASIENEMHACETEEVRVLTLPLQQVDSSMASSVGAKNANLGELGNIIKMPIPLGFAITTRAGELFLRKNSGLFDRIQRELTSIDIDDPSTVQKASNNILQAILKTPVPIDVAGAIIAAYDKAFSNQDVPVAVRSSAISEDGVQSFAGQYLSLLGVQRDGLLEAFKRVFASMYSARALSYRLVNGHELSSAGMAMVCLKMVRAQSAGVAFSRHPVNLRSNDVLINGVWGLGEAVADGSALPDEWLVSRATMTITREHIVDKLTRVVLRNEKNADGTAGKMVQQIEEVEEMMQHLPCLTQEQVLAIAKAAIRLELHYQYPQDIEWAIDEDEQLLFLQTRPMGFDATSADERTPELKDIKPVIRSAEVAAKGVACGKVMVMDPDEDMTHFPEGWVLVLTHSSPHATVVMQRACAIIAEVGSLTGHMASVCREYGVPTLINTPGASTLLKDGQLVTVDAFKGRVFDGEIPELLELRISRPPVANTPAMAFMRRMAPHVLPLHLVDPRGDTFTPEHCTSLHDIMRFIHEKSYAEMFMLSDSVSDSSANVATRFSGPIPLDLYIIDLGGGLRDPETKFCLQEDVTCYPFQFVLSGMLAPEVQAKGPRPINMRGFISVMGHSALGPSAGERFGDHSYAIISDRYLNFSSRVGYHYAILDSWCGKTVSKNYIRFEFAGGAAGSLQRERRVRCIGLILKELGFRVSIIADRVQARYQKYPRDQIASRLDQLGRLLIMTRQMDMLMTSEDAVQTFASNFLNGRYH